MMTMMCRIFSSTDKRRLLGFKLVNCSKGMNTAVVLLLHTVLMSACPGLGGVPVNAIQGF